MNDDKPTLFKITSFEDKWQAYKELHLNAANFPESLVMMLRSTFYAGGLAATGTMLEVQQDMLQKVMDQLNPHG